MLTHENKMPAMKILKFGLIFCALLLKYLLIACVLIVWTFFVLVVAGL